MNELISLYDPADAEQYNLPELPSQEEAVEEQMAEDVSQAATLESQIRMSPTLVAVFSFGSVMLLGLSVLALDTIIQLAM